MERTRIRIEHQRQEMAVAVPQRQLEHAFHRLPLEHALGVVRMRLARVRVDDEDEAEPVLAALAEAWPADRAAQAQRGALDAGLLADLAAHAGDDILVALEL